MLQFNDSYVNRPAIQSFTYPRILSDDHPVAGDTEIKKKIELIKDEKL